MSWTRTLVVTLPPASRQTRVAALSNVNPRRPNTPANGHAARWWARESSGRPHRQVDEDRDKGCQRRRRNNTLSSWGWNVVSGEIGKQVYGRPAIGPCWERRRACSGGASVGQIDSTRKLFSTTSEAFCCHTCLLVPGMRLAMGSKSGRALRAKYPHSLGLRIPIRRGSLGNKLQLPCAVHLHLCSKKR